MTAGSTITCKFCSSISKILFKRSIDNPIPSYIDKAPPLKPVLAPIGVVGILYSLATFSIAEIS